MSSLSDFMGNASSSLKGSATRTIGDAASQGAQGNVSGAVSTLLNGPQSALSSIGAQGGATMGDDFAGLQKRGDAVQNWCWYAVMPDVSNPNAVSGGTLQALGQSVGVGQPVVSLPWYYVQTANVPDREFQVESIKRNGHEVHFPSSYSVGSLTLGLFMDDRSVAEMYCKAWAAQVMGNQNPKIVSNQGQWGYPSAYKKDINIVVLSVRRNVLLNVKLMNCWLTQKSALELTSGEASAMVREVTFSVEDIDITVNNDKGLLDTLSNTATGYAASALGSVLGGAVNNAFTTLGL